MTRSITATVWAVAVVALAVAQQPAPPDPEPDWKFQSKPAAEAKQRFDQAMKEHRAAYVKAVTEAEQTLLKDLKSAMSEARSSRLLELAASISARPAESMTAIPTVIDSTSVSPILS